METEDIIILGGAALAGYLIYQSFGSGLKKTTDAVGDVAGATGKTLTQWINLANPAYDADLIKTAFTGMNNYFASLQQNQSAQGQNNQDSVFIGSTNSKGDTFGVKQGTLGLSLLNPRQNSSSQGMTWLRITPTNTVTAPTTASDWLRVSQNPNVQNVSVNSGNSFLVAQKPISIPPSLLSLATGRY